MACFPLRTARHIAIIIVSLPMAIRPRQWRAPCSPFCSDTMGPAESSAIEKLRIGGNAQDKPDRLENLPPAFEGRIDMGQGA